MLKITYRTPGGAVHTQEEAWQSVNLASYRLQMGGNIILDVDETDD